MKLYIKNMVCGRCKRVVQEELEKLGLKLESVELGEVDLINLPDTISIEAIRNTLEENGFELIDDKKSQLIEHIKSLVINEIHYGKSEKQAYENFSAFLSRKIGYEYSFLSNLFSSVESTTIEKYIIAQKVEKIKELLAYEELSLSEIAWKLDYSSVQHLSNQFKQLIGLTPGEFRKSTFRHRNEIDKVAAGKDAHLV